MFTVEDGWVSKSYGVKTPTMVIVFDRDAELPFSLSYIFADARLDCLRARRCNGRARTRGQQQQG